MYTQSEAAKLHSPEQLQKENKRLRRELREVQRSLVQKDEEVRDYFSMLSHEIKTPIISMRGYSDLFLDQFGQVHQGMEYIKKVVRNIDQLEILLNDLSLISRQDVDEDSFEWVDIGDLLLDIRVSLHGELYVPSSSIQIQPGMPLIKGNRTAIWHVFSNLITNAIKYKNDHVDLDVKIGYLDDELFRKFYIKDNGVGIPVRAQKSVFDMFTRAGNKRGAQGTGLGLPIAKKFIAVHGGEIWLSSKPGKGTTFYFTLPKAKHKKQPAKTDGDARNLPS